MRKFMTGSVTSVSI
ncbi:MAG: hypothetical protein ACK4QP_14180 [Pseudorhizobium sp.]